MFYRNAHGVLYVFDMSREETLEHIEHTWIPQVGGQKSGTDLSGSSVVRRCINLLKFSCYHELNKYSRHLDCKTAK